MVNSNVTNTTGDNVEDEFRIYSLNLCAYILANAPYVGLRFVQDKDKNYIYYGVVDEDISDIKDRYKADVMLHRFLQCFKDIKYEIRELKNGK
ncbi:MAG: hypothetical protein K9L62_16530 [Vallitaleaceae bacterium]|nr:hypothetical protein [Vallitaleaceae bacterium]